jgi:hypothetical protein
MCCKLLSVGNLLLSFVASCGMAGICFLFGLLMLYPMLGIIPYSLLILLVAYLLLNLVVYLVIIVDKLKFICVDKKIIEVEDEDAATGTKKTKSNPQGRTLARGELLKLYSAAVGDLVNVDFGILKERAQDNGKANQGSALLRYTAMFSTPVVKYVAFFPFGMMLLVLLSSATADAANIAYLLAENEASDIKLLGITSSETDSMTEMFREFTGAGEGITKGLHYIYVNSWDDLYLFVEALDPSKIEAGVKAIFVASTFDTFKLAVFSLRAYGYIMGVAIGAIGLLISLIFNCNEAKQNSLKMREIKSENEAKQREQARMQNGQARMGCEKPTLNTPVKGPEAMEMSRSQETQNPLFRGNVATNEVPQVSV